MKSHSGTNNWNNNNIQFPRLIAELESVGCFTDEICERLCEEMDLNPPELKELIERAQTEWDKIKQNIP